MPSATTPAAVWRRLASPTSPSYNGLLGMAVWSTQHGPHLIEYHTRHGQRPVAAVRAVPSLRAAAAEFVDAFPSDDVGMAWQHPAPSPDMAPDELVGSLFAQPKTFDVHPSRVIEGVLDAVGTAAAAAGTVAPTPTLTPIELAAGRTYVPRPVADTTDVAMLRAARGHLPTRIKGLPSNGKTMLAEAAFGDDLIVVQGHGDLMVDDLIGRYLPDPGSSGYHWHDGPVVRAMKDGKVLLVDELTRAPSDTVNALLSATDDRRMLVIDGRPDLPVVHAADGFHVVVTYNETGVGVRPLDPAVVRRFPLELEVTTDLNLVAQLGVDDRFIEVARRLRALDRKAAEHGELSVWSPQTGHLLKAQQALELLGERGGAGVLLAACTEAHDRAGVAEVISDVFAIDNPALTQEELP